MGERSRLLALPAEILIQILSHVGDLRSLNRARRVCKRFAVLLSDTGRSVDINLWRPCAVDLLSHCSPISHPFDVSWQAFLLRARLLSAFPSSWNSELRTLLPYKHELLTTTSIDRRQSPDTLVPQVPFKSASTHVPETAEILFLHSSTEASRTREGPYFSVKDNVFLFSDDPEDLGIATVPSDFERGYLSTGGKINRLEDSYRIDLKKLALDMSYWATAAYLKSCLHSDPDLVLHHYVNAPLSPFFHPPIKLTLRIGSDPRKWNLSAVDGWTDLSYDKKPPNMRTVWEFRSAGDFLVICDDNNGRRASTLTCFRSNTEPGPWLWQVAVFAPTFGFFYDNDGICITSSFVVYATRTILPMYRPRNDPNGLASTVAKFLLFSTETGDLIRTLDFSPESRLCEGSYSWCSFAASDTLIAATFGGELPRRSNRFQYPWLIVWDLCQSEEDPIMMGRLPERWGDRDDSYVAISGDGKTVFVTVHWNCVAWDVITKQCIGEWKVEGQADWQAEWATVRSWQKCDGWNGLWIAYKENDEVGMAWMPGRMVRYIVTGRG